MSRPMPPVDSLMPNRPVNGPMRLANWRREAERVGGGGAHLAVVGGPVGLVVSTSTCSNDRDPARIVDDLDEVVLVLRGLEPKLDVALDGVGEEVVVGAQADDRLQAVMPPTKSPTPSTTPCTSLMSVSSLVSLPTVPSPLSMRADTESMWERALSSDALARFTRSTVSRTWPTPPFTSPWFSASSVRTSWVIDRTFSRICL